MLQNLYKLVSSTLDASEFAIAKFSPCTPTKVFYLYDYTPKDGPVWTKSLDDARLFYDINDIKMNFPLYDKTIHLAFSWLDGWEEEDILRELGIDQKSLVNKNKHYGVYDLPEIAIAAQDELTGELLYLSNPQTHNVSWTTDREEAYLFYDYNDAKRIFKLFNASLHIMFTWLDDWSDAELKQQFNGK